MTYFLQSTTEENLYLCILNGVWGAKTNKLSHWQEGDQMIAYVDRALAAVFTITSEQYYDETPIWPGEIYPYRVNIQLEKIVHPSARYSISNKDLRDILFKHHTKSYAVVLVLSARPLADIPAQKLFECIAESPDWADFKPKQALKSLQKEKQSEQSVLAEEVVQARSVEDEKQSTLHTEIQFYLAQLGRSLSYQVWIPKPDQGKKFNGVQLRKLSEPELPNLHFSQDVERIVKYIDVIWLKHSSPAHLFEVEHTTNIYSGLLRMSDLTTLMPALNIGMYICADPNRKKQVSLEAARPTFNREPVSLIDRCRFIPFDKLTEFIAEYQKILGHLSPSILSELSEPLIRPSI